MANVNIKFNGKDFLLSCDDGQEEHLEELANHLSDKFNKLKSDLWNIGENKLLLITSIQVIDEYFDLKEKDLENIDDVLNLEIESFVKNGLKEEWVEKKIIIPNWYYDSICWWVEGKTTEYTLMKSLEYMLTNKII